MKVNENLLSGVFVQRETQSVVEQPATQYEDLEGLPFYYSMNTSFAYLLIALGIIVLIGQVLFFVFGCIIPFCMKRFICTKCRRKIIRFKNPKKCSICGGVVVPIEDFDPDKK